MALPTYENQTIYPDTAANTAWTSYDPLDIDDIVAGFQSSGQDANYAHDTDSGTNEQNWECGDITALDDAVLREANIFLCWNSGFSGASSVRILLGATHYAGTLISTGTYGSFVWEVWRTTPNVSIDSAIVDPVVKVTSPTGQVRLNCFHVQCIKLRNAYILRPASDHGDNDWGDYTAIDDPQAPYSTLRFDSSEVHETGKTTAGGTWALAYTDAIPSTSGGTLAFIGGFGYENKPTRIYVNNVSDESHLAITTDGFTSTGPQLWYRTDDISSGISNMGLGVVEGNLGTGVDGDPMEWGFLVAAYNDSSYGFERLLLNGNGPSGRFYSQMSNGMDAKTDGSWPNYSYGLGNETLLFDLENMPTDFQEITGLTFLIHFAVSALSANNTYLASVRLVESDESTALTDTVDASGLTLSTSYFTHRLDFSTLNNSTNKTKWDGALLELDFDIEGAGTDSFRIGEIELIMEYKKSPPEDPVYDHGIAQRHFLTIPPIEWFNWA